MNKRILFVVNIDWFFVSHRLPLALEALRRGYEVHIACSVSDKINYLQHLGFFVHPLKLSRSGLSIAKEVSSFIEIYKLLKMVRPDIAHFITIKPVLYGGCLCRFIKINKIVFSISGLGFVFIKKGFIASTFRFFIKAMYKFSLGSNRSHIIVQNPDDKNFINSIVRTPVTMIRGSGVDLTKYAFVEERIQPVVTICMACRLLKDKGVWEFVNAAKLLSDKKLKARFQLYGDVDPSNPASLTEEDLKKIQQDGIVQVFAHTDFIFDVFSGSNIVVLPSYREGLPKVLIEASACGRAIVTTDVPGCRDAIQPNITGLLCKVGDAHSLAHQIEKLVLDTELRIKMGQQGRLWAENEFSINNVVAAHFHIYNTH